MSSLGNTPAPARRGHGSEGVYADGSAIDVVTTGAYGFHLQQGFAFAYLAPEYAELGTELEVRVVRGLRPGAGARRAGLRPGEREATDVRSSDCMRGTD